MKITSIIGGVTNVKGAFLVGALLLSSQAWAQVLPVGTHAIEEKYRRDQLLGLVDSTVSFTIRPLSSAVLQRNNIFDPDSVFESNATVYSTADGEGYINLMPVGLQYRYNSSFPYGWNDGSMVPSVGGQAMITGGIFAKYKFLTVQFQPEIVVASNQRYEEFAKMPGFGLEWYRMFGNKIDMPEYFGRGGYANAAWGQSSIRLNFDPVSFGFSTENLWWGPGVRNALLMSNTATGFPHLTVNTIRPVETNIGSFEGQLVGGILRASGYPSSYTEESRHHEFWSIEKPDVNRYFSGLVFNYQPKWVPGLTVGHIRTFVVNRSNMNSNLRDFLPFFSPSVDEATYLNDDAVATTTDDFRIQYGSLFFRWVMPAGQFEVYGEYGKNLKPVNARDLIVQSTHSRGYVLGFRKLLPMNFIKAGDIFQIGAEVTQLAFNTSFFQRRDPVPSWYTHHVVRDGYTNRGQVLGAGIGPGSNLQSVQFSWIRGLKQIGLQVERLMNKEDFLYITYGPNDIRRSWVDLGVSAFGDWDFDKIIVSAGLHYAYAHNYRFAFYQSPENTGFWDFEPQDETNFNLRIGISYRF